MRRKRDKERKEKKGGAKSERKREGERKG